MPSKKSKPWRVPDAAEGSDGRDLDPLATLAFLAGATQRIGLGTAVLILPYRPALRTAKWIATIQELSGGRLRLGVGVGWMRAEFRAAGVDRARRGGIADETLAVLHECIAKGGDDVVAAMGRIAIEDAARAAEQVAVLATVDVTRFVHAERYVDRDGFAEIAARLARCRSQ